MFKLNTMLPVYYDHKENKIYMINTTTRKIYYHSYRFNNLRIAIIVVIAGGFSSYLQRNYAQLYLNEPSEVLKISLIIMSIVVGILLWLVSVKKRYQPLFKEYLKQKPRPTEIKNIDEIKKSLDRTRSTALMTLLLTSSLFIWSVVLFNRFLTDTDHLSTYIFATLLFLTASYFSSRIDHALFILKLTIR